MLPICTKEALSLSLTDVNLFALVNIYSTCTVLCQGNPLNLWEQSFSREKQMLGESVAQLRFHAHIFKLHCTSTEKIFFKQKNFFHTLRSAKLRSVRPLWQAHWIQTVTSIQVM